MERRLFNHNYFTLLDLYNISVFFILRSRIIHILFFLFWLFFSLLAQSKISGSITRSKSVINFFFPFIVNASEHLQISRVDWNIHVVEERRKIREKRVEKGGYCILPFEYLTRLHFSCFLFILWTRLSKIINSLLWNNSPSIASTWLISTTFSFNLSSRSSFLL